MRTRVIFAVAVLAAIATVVAVAQASVSKLPSEIQMPKGCKQLTTVKSFAPFSAKVWDVRRWRREPHGEPREATIKAKQRRIHCAISDGQAALMEGVWRADRKHFRDVRKPKMQAKRAREVQEAVIAPHASHLASIRSCESGGNYSINTGNGFYGAYQFTLSTWISVGGSGYPHEASKLEQDYRAALLLNASGSSPWPVCG